MADSKINAQNAVARVEETSVGPKLFVNDVLVYWWLGCMHDEKVKEIARKINAAPQPAQADARIDVEALLRACVPGGDICDPQRIADSIREWFDDHGAQADARVGLTDEQREALEWAVDRAHVASLGKPIVGIEGRRHRALRDLLNAAPKEIPEGCTQADAQMLREANHALAAENDALRRALRPFARIVSTDKLSWARVEYCVEGDPEKQTFQAPQMQRAFNRAAEILRDESALAARPGQPEPRAEVALFADNDERDKFIHACQDFDDDGETDIDYGLLMKWAVAGLLDCDHFTITKKGRAAIDAARKGEPQ